MGATVTPYRRFQELQKRSRLEAKTRTPNDFVTIQDYLADVAQEKIISPKDITVVLKALAPVIKLVPFVERRIIEAALSEAKPDDWDSLNVPRSLEFETWQEAQQKGEVLLPEFDFWSTYKQFLVTPQNDPENTIIQLWGLEEEVEAEQQQQYVPPQFRSAELFFLICLRILRVQYRCGNSFLEEVVDEEGENE